MGLKDIITNDMKTAMKAGDTARLSTVRMLLSEIKKKEIDTRVALDDPGIHKILSTMVKQRNDSIEAFTKGNRPELAEAEKAEIVVLTAYLPQQLDAAEVEKLVVAAIAETGATQPADIGKVMKAAIAKAGGRADGKLVNELARAKLTPK